MIAAIEDVIAAAATDQPAAQPKLIGNNAECGLTVGAAGGQTWRSLWRSCHAGRGEKSRPREYCRQRRQRRPLQGALARNAVKLRR
ncbi:hypothetical protein NQ024_15230, partial [Corynebacterium sp. 35RC1]|nr:hypothetical protein [Corynebacterium sp. 35RC1]